MDVRITDGSKKITLTADGKIPVDAQVTAEVTDSKVKVSPDNGATFKNLKSDADGNLYMEAQMKTVLDTMNTVLGQIKSVMSPYVSKHVETFADQTGWTGGTIVSSPIIGIQVDATTGGTAVTGQKLYGSPLELLSQFALNINITNLTDLSSITIYFKTSSGASFYWGIDKNLLKEGKNTVLFDKTNCTESASIPSWDSIVRLAYTVTPKSTISSTVSVVFGKLDTIAESSRKLANNFTFQSLASTASDGTAYSAYYDCAATFEIVGSSTSKTVYFEMAGPYGVFIPVNAQNVATLDMADRTTMGTNTTPESWKVEIPAGYKFRARVEVANGNVSVAGRVVAR